MQLLKHREDRINVLRAFLAPVIFFLPFYTGLPDGYELPVMALIYVLVGKTNYILHLHIHNPFTHSRTLNILLDLSMASVTAMTASNWRIQHLRGHHRGIDMLFRGPKDWEVEQYSPMRALSYCFRSMWLTFWRPLAQSFIEGASDSRRHPFLCSWAIAEHLLLLLLFVFLAWLNTELFLSYALPLYALTYFITRYVDYLNHYGCDEDNDSVFEHANNSTNPLFNALCNNFGYHTAHHLKPGAHWTTLPDIHKGIEDEIPARRLKPQSWSWVLLPYHFYLSYRGRM